MKGTFDPTIQQQKTTYGGGNITSTQGLSNNGQGTSQVTFLGTEDLGGGLKANFQLQLTPDFINGNAVGGSGADNIGTGQQAFVGLEGGLGTLKLGRVNTNALDAWGVGSVFGTALGSGYGSNGNIFTRYSTAAPVTAYQSAPTRFNNAIRLETASFSGFSGSYLFVPKVNAVGGNVTSTTAASNVATNREGVSEFGLKYSNGPLNVAYANQKVSQGSEGVVDAQGNLGVATLAANKENKLSILSANYTIGAATVYGATWTEKQDTSTAVDTSGRMIGAKYVMGATTLMASMGSSNDKTSANVDKKIAGIGADYALSKRTALYARYDTRDANKNSATDDATNGSTKRTAIGVRHTF